MGIDVSPTPFDATRRLGGVTSTRTDASFCLTQVLITFGLRRCLRAYPQTGLVHFCICFGPSAHIVILTALVLVCLSADWAGALVRFKLFSFVFVFRLVSCLTIDSLALLSWVFLVCCFLWVVCWGLQCTACSLRPALVVLLWPASRGLLLFVWFLLVVSRVSVGRVFFAVVFLGCFVLLCVWCLGLVPLGLLSPCFAPSLPAPSVCPLAFWSSQCSAGPSLWVSGCICDGPFFFPLVWPIML